MSSPICLRTISPRRARRSRLTWRKPPGDLPDASAHVVEGHAARTILDWAESHEPDCIVIASHRPGMQDLLLGSTANGVLHGAKCDVLAIRVKEAD